MGYIVDLLKMVIYTMYIIVEPIMKYIVYVISLIQLGKREDFLNKNSVLVTKL